MQPRIRLAVVSSVLLAGIVGCDALESESDKKHKANLIGTWYSQTKDPNSNAKIDVLIVVAPDGKFKATRRLIEPGRPVEIDNETGEWFVTGFVTDSLYKRRTDSLNGKLLGRAEQGYSTCRIESITGSELVCVNDVAKFAETQRRVPANFQLP